MATSENQDKSGRRLGHLLRRPQGLLQIENNLPGIVPRPLGLGAVLKISGDGRPGTENSLPD